MLPLRLLFRSLTFLLGLLYLGGVCELDADEARQHYAHESHDYLAAPTTVDVPAPASQSAAPAGAVVVGLAPAPCPAFVGRRGKRNAWPWEALPPPPLRQLYLRCAVLQV